MAYNQLGQHDAAFDVIRSAIAIDPVQGYPYSSLAETFAYIGQVDSFYHYLEHSFELGMSTAAIKVEVPPYRNFADTPRFDKLLQKYAPELKD